MEIINAKIARTNFFEDYVDFEHFLRTIAIKSGIKSKGISLNEIIVNISNTKTFPSFGLTAKLLRLQKNRRNWLAHMHGNAKVPALLLNDFNKINVLNEKLKKIIKNN